MPEKGKAGRDYDFTIIVATDEDGTSPQDVVNRAKELRSVIEDELLAGSVVAIKKGDGPVRLIDPGSLKKFIKKGYQRFDPFGGVE